MTIAEIWVALIIWYLGIYTWWPWDMLGNPKRGSEDDGS